MFNFLKKKVPSQRQTTSTRKNTEDSEMWCFNDLKEFIIYQELRKKKNVVWMKSDEYDKYWNDGFKLFDVGQYDDAIRSYQKCLSMNPISLYVRFEITECYIQLHNYVQAMNILTGNVKNLLYNEDIARFYRRVGYINIELKNYDCAVACYLYSGKFENHPSIQQEIMYITQQLSEMPQVNNPEEVLKDNNIIIISK